MTDETDLQQAVRIAHIDAQVSAMAAVLAEVMPKVANALERIAVTEERQAVANARLRKLEQRNDRLAEKVNDLTLAADRNTGARGVAAKAFWAVLGAALSLAVALMLRGAE